MAVSRRKYSKKLYTRKRYSYENMFIIYIGLFFVLGIFIGAVYASLMSAESLTGLYRHTDNVIYGTQLYGLDKGVVFKDSLFKYGKTVMIIWFLSFVPFGSMISLFVLGVKGASVGFSTALLVRYYDFKGLWYSIILYFPQTVIIVTSYFFLIYFCMKSGEKQGTKKPQKTVNNLGEKILCLAAASTGIVMGCFFEAYISPGLISTIL